MDDVQPVTIVDFMSYLRRKEIRVRSKQEMIAYVKKDGTPISFVQRFTDIPSNELYGCENWIEMKTALKGEDIRRISDLNSAQKEDPKARGKMVAAYTESEVMFIMLADIITDWSFPDESGNKAPISPANIEGLVKPDVDWLGNKFSAMVGAPASDKNAETPNTEPKDGITPEEEKK